MELILKLAFETEFEGPDHLEFEFELVRLCGVTSMEFSFTSLASISSPLETSFSGLTKNRLWVEQGLHPLW